MDSDIQADLTWGPFFKVSFKGKFGITCIFFLVFGILSRIHDAHSDYLMTFLIISYPGIKIPLAFNLILDLHENLKCCSTAIQATGKSEITDENLVVLLYFCLWLVLHLQAGQRKKI